LILRDFDKITLGSVMKNGFAVVAQIFILFFFVQISMGQELNRIDIRDTYPWCIVAYDSLERLPAQRIQMIKELGFNKYAYDWRDRHLEDTSLELQLAMDNHIEIVSVWLWLNAKRDSIELLSQANERMFKIIEQLDLKTTLWVSLSGNFFKDLNHEQSLSKAVEIIDFITMKATELDCKVALYNHSGWFGNPYNQLEVIEALPHHKLGMVYNFHHAHGSIEDIPKIVNAIKPYLKAVNLNGMKKDGNKILAIGKGDHEKEMIKAFRASGFTGPWGILGHVENTDVKKILLENIEGLRSLHDQ